MTSAESESRRRILSFDLGSRNMAFALVEEPHTLIRWGMIDLGINQARQATENLIDLFRSADYAWINDDDCDIVVELQPRNGVCKTLSHVMQAYFYYTDPLRTFHFMTASNKLKFDAALYDEVSPKTHADRKIVSMHVVEKYITNKECALYKFYASRNHKQQTDLADAYIQACRYLQTIKVPKRKRGAPAQPQHRPSHFPECSDFCPQRNEIEEKYRNLNDNIDLEFI